MRRPSTHRTQCNKAEMTKKKPFFHRKTLISRELRKIAPCAFQLCKLGRKGFHLVLFWATPPPPRPPWGGAREVKSRDFQKCRPSNTCSPPLLKISPILLKLGMIALKTFIHKTVDQTFDIFSLRRDLGYQTWSNPKIEMKHRPN